MTATLLRRRGDCAARRRTPTAPDFLAFSNLANGAVAPSPWVVPTGTTGTAVEVQSQRLEFTSGSGAGAYHGGRAHLGSPYNGLADFDRVATLRVENPVVSQYCNFVLRLASWHATGDYPQDGYLVSFRPSSATEKLIIAESTGGVFSQRAAANPSFTAGQAMRLWTRITGAGPVEIKAWLWPESQAVEPTDLDTPTITWTDSDAGYHTSGFWGFGMASDAAQKKASIDDILLGPATLGKSSVGATPGNLNSDYQLGSKFTLAGGTLKVARIRAYLDGGGAGVGAQLLKATIYTGNAGNTTNGTLQATSAEVSIADGQAAGWVDFSFATPPTLTAGTYWLNLHLGTVSATARIYRDATSNGSGYFADTYSDGPVASGGTYILETGVMSIYATTIAAAGGGGGAGAALFSDASAVLFSDASTVNFGS